MQWKPITYCPCCQPDCDYSGVFYALGSNSGSMYINLLSQLLLLHLVEVIQNVHFRNSSPKEEIFRRLLKLT